MDCVDENDSDEDVILPNSPLSHYISQCEHVEQVPLLNYMNSDFSCRHNVHLSSKKSLKFSDISKVLHFDRLKVFLCSLKTSFVPSFDFFEYHLHRYILNAVRRSDILVTEDSEFLKNLESEEFLNSYDRVSSPSNIKQLFIILGLNCIVMTLIYALQFTTKMHEISSIYFLCAFLQILFHILYLIYYLNFVVIFLCVFVNFVEILYFIVIYFKLKNVMFTLQNLFLLFKKNIRLIQEAELVTRGFTCASVLGIAERIELSSHLPISQCQRQLPELRKCLFIWARDVFFNYRHTTLQLLQSLPCCPELDFSSHSLATLDLKEFGELLKYDMQSEDELEQLMNISDNLCITSLKTVHQLMQLQISEFFKYFYIITSFISIEEKSEILQKVRYLMAVNSNLDSSNKNLSSLLTKSMHTYKYYKSIEAAYSSKSSDQFSNSLKKSKIEIIVNNMSLHLKAALKRINEIEEYLDLNSVNKESSDCFQKIEMIFKEVNCEVDAFKDYSLNCFEELKEVYKKNKTVYPNPISYGSHQLEHENVHESILKCDIECEILDEVFEAIVSKSSEDSEYVQSTENIDPELYKRNREATSHLMKELKNILVLKADECRTREALALARKGGANVEENVNALQNDTDCLGEINEMHCEKNLGVELSKEKTNEIQSSNFSQDNFHLQQNSGVTLCSANQNDFLKFQQILNKKTESLAVSVASLAMQRQNVLGISPDECFGDDSDAEN